MPAKELMTWVPSRRRWTRMYKGKRYWVSCKALGVPETKEASYQAANAWWRAKQLEIDAASRPAPRALLPLEDITGTLHAGDPRAFDVPAAALSAARGDEQVEYPLPDDEPVFLDPVTRRLLPGVPPAILQAAIQEVARQLLARYVVGGEPLPEPVIQALPAPRVQQVKDGIAALRGEPTVATDHQVATHVDKWVKLQQDKATAGRSAKAADNQRIRLYHFRDFLGGQTDVSCIDSDRLYAFYLWCRGKAEERYKDASRKAGWSRDYAEGVFRLGKRFIKYLWENRLLEQMPRNWGSREFTFDVGEGHSVKTWTVEEFQVALTAAGESQLKLHMLLMANCGFYGRDISDLRHDEVDWEAGRIRHRRTKTARQKSSVLVDHILWPTTFELLKKHRSSHPTLVLLTKSGSPWICEEQVGGKLRWADNIRSNFSALRQRKLIKTHPAMKARSLKQLRKLGPSLLKAGPYADLGSYFAGHAPLNITERHYEDKSAAQKRFDEAVLWLGQKLGQVPVEEPAAEKKPRGKGRKAR